MTDNTTQLLILSDHRRIRRTIISLQGLFIKVGQLFSIMTNILPGAFRDELETLHSTGPADKGPYSLWEKNGRLTLEDKAAREVDRILETHKVEPLPEA